MAAHGVKLDTLKDCLQFLEWLRIRIDMKHQVVTALVDHLKNPYNNAEENQIQPALSTFLERTSSLYKKLCKSSQPGTYGNNKKSTHIFNALLECIPKFLAALYFLRYHVDENFKALGGGGWKDFYPGYGASGSGGMLDEYLTAKERDKNYKSKIGVIPGGFSKSELKYGYTDSRYGYYQGKNMAKELETLFDKHAYQFFRDVFSTSVLLETSSVEISNVANALALVRTFCGIVGDEKNTDNGGELIQRLNLGLKSTGKRICWSNLRMHCAALQSQFSKIFSDHRFSFTGYGRTLQHLNKESCAKEVAQWLREHLHELRGKLAQINSLSTMKLRLPRRFFNSSAGLPDAYSKELAEYFNKNIFPYGFTFDKTNFGKDSYPYDVLEENWNGVVDLLKRKDDGGLDKLKKILDGEICPKNEADETQKLSEEPEVPPAKVPEVPKKVVPEAKPEGAQNQGKKAEGAQNQGKKAEGAQNQGKKAEGAQNQGKKAEGTPPSTLQGAEPTHPPSAPNSDPKSSGAPDTSSGQVRDGHAGSQLAQQSQEAQTVRDDSNRPSDATGTRSRGSGAGGGGAPGGGSSGSANTFKCPPGKVETRGLRGNKVCLSEEAFRRASGFKDTWEAIYNEMQKNDDEEERRKAEENERRKQAAYEQSVLEWQKRMPYLEGKDIFSSNRYTHLGGLDGSVVQDNYDNDYILLKQQQAAEQKWNEQKQEGKLQKHLDEYAIGQQEKRNQAAKEIGEILKGATEETWKLQQQQYVDDISNSVSDNTKKRLQQKLSEQKKKSEQQNISVDPPASSDSTLPSQPSRPAPAPSGQNTGGRAGHRRDYYDWQNMQTNNVGIENELSSHTTLMTLPDIGGEVVPDVSSKELQEKIHKNVGAILKLKSAEWQAEEDVVMEKLITSNLDGEPVAGVHYPDALGVSGVEVTDKRSNDEDMEQLHAEMLDKELNAQLERVAFLKKIENEQKKEIDKFNKNAEDEYNAIVDKENSKIYVPAKSVSFDDLSSLPKETIAPPMSLMTDFNGLPTSEAKGNSPMPATPQIDFHIEKPFTPERIYDTDRIQENPPPGVAHNKIVLPSDIPPQPPFHEEFDSDSLSFATVDLCLAPWATSTPTPGSTDIHETELFPAEAPRTVRDMLQWLAGLKNPKHHKTLKQCIEKAFTGFHKDPSQLALFINHAKIRPGDVFDILQLTAMFASSVITAVAPNWKANVSSRTVKSKSSEEPDCCALLCQLRDYVYACCHQLQFLKLQCKRGKSHGGWQDCKYGSDLKTASPLQSFLIDGWDSTFETHLFDPCNPCHKSRIRMGFKKEDLPSSQQTGTTLATILSPSCGGDDPLLTLCSYLNCLTRRTPRTTGELVSYFHHFGNELHGYDEMKLSPLGNSLINPHDHCPDWDRLGRHDLQAVKGIRGSESLNVISKNNPSHDTDHPRTLSTLVGCGSVSANCHPHCSPITYRAYSLYSPTFAHTYLSWAVSLPDKLWESLDKLHYDLKKHVSIKCSSLYLCSTALPLLYTHGITPPEGISQQQLKCSDVIEKLQEIVNGKPIASLMTCMDEFLYGIREPFIFTIVPLWSLAFLIFANTTLYRLDILHIRSHLIRSKASHRIDVKALLTKGRKMLSLYKDVDYFDEDPIGQLGVTHSM